MNIKPVLYLRNVAKASAEALKKISALGFPVIVHAQDLQICSNSAEFFSSIPSALLHVISHEVEAGVSHFQQVLQKAQVEEWTHIISVSHFEADVIQGLEALPDKLKISPFDFIFFVSPYDVDEKNNALMQRLLDLGDFDYRHLKTTTAVYPVFYVQDLTFKKEDGLDDLRILVDCLRNKRPYQTLTMESVPDFKTQVGKWKEKLLDTWLVTLSSLHRDQRPIHSAVSFAVGAFLACTPFYGLQTALIIAVTMIGRLSFPVAFLGSQISLPPIYSLIVPLQLYVGFQITGTEFTFEGPLLDVARNHFLAWFIGSMIVGGILSVAMGLIWYWVQKSSQEKKVNWTGTMRGGKFGNHLMVFLLKSLGLKFSYFLLYFIVPYFYLFAPTARRGLNQYYKLREPETGWLGRQIQVLSHLYSFAQILVDQAYQASRESLSFDIQYTSGNVLRQHHEPGARVMLFSHFGGWAISTQGFSRRQTQKPIHMIRYQTQDLSPDDVFRETNQSNLRPIAIRPGEPVFMAIHQVLREDGHLAIMGDRPFDNNFELKNFLGRLAPIPTTPFRLAKTYKAKLSFVSGFRRSFKAYGLATETYDMETLSIDEAVNKYVEFLSQSIRDYPKQWFNLYSYWSSLPTLPNGYQCLPTKNQILRQSKALTPQGESDKGL